MCIMDKRMEAERDGREEEKQRKKLLLLSIEGGNGLDAVLNEGRTKCKNEGEVGEDGKISGFEVQEKGKRVRR